MKSKISYEEFKEKILKRLNSEFLYFGMMSDSYYAEYRPNFPKETEFDFAIDFCWLTGEGNIIGNSQQNITTNKRFESFERLLDFLDKYLKL